MQLFPDFYILFLTTSYSNQPSSVSRRVFCSLCLSDPWYTTLARFQKVSKCCRFIFAVKLVGLTHPAAAGCMWCQERVQASSVNAEERSFIRGETNIADLNM